MLLNHKRKSEKSMTSDSFHYKICNLTTFSGNKIRNKKMLLNIMMIYLRRKLRKTLIFKCLQAGCTYGELYLTCFLCVNLAIQTILKVANSIH